MHNVSFGMGTIRKQLHHLAFSCNPRGTIICSAFSL